MATSQKTNVIGYFNPNGYPLQLSIAEFNVVLQLPPKAYVVDRTGRLVNDPILDRYVGKGKLSRASDPKQQVDVTLLRPVNDPAPTPAPHQHSVSQAQRFETKNGVVTAVAPVSTAPVAATPPPQSYNPVRGLTIEQAKALKLIKPTRVVPEDYGAEETTGAPKSGQEIPAIKYATDTVRGRKPAPLPAELAQPATPEQQAIISGLERASMTNPDDPNALTSLTRRVVSESALPIQPSAFPKPQLDDIPQPVPVTQRPARVTAPPIPLNPTPTVLVEAPPAEEETGLVVEEELSGAQPPAERSIAIEQRVESASRLVPPPSDDAFNCPLCPSKSFANKGLFLRHVRRFHSQDEEVLMAPYANKA